MKHLSFSTGFALLCSLPFAVALLSRPSAPQGPAWLTLTPEQAQILGHMRLVHVEHPQLGSLPTLVVEGLNVQLVNGLGATNGYRLDPLTIDPALVQTNGLFEELLGIFHLSTGELQTGDVSQRHGLSSLVAGFPEQADAPWIASRNSMHVCSPPPNISGQSKVIFANASIRHLDAPLKNASS